jgi:quinohemoprotein ethanol dehydrogenase
LWSTQTFDPQTPRNLTGAPLAFNGKVLIGHGGGDLGPVRGYVTAYDAHTGKQMWRFYTVPGNPADGFENDAMKMAATTWTGNWWKLGGGGAVWNSMTYDPEFNRVYIGTGNGVPWNQHIRSPDGGDNLFVASIVALDANSGRYAWHYQETPGDDWDYDAAVDMVQADLLVDGKSRKALLQASKNGFFYVIDRATGKLISAAPFVTTNWAKRIDLQTGRPVEEPGMRAADTSIIVRPSAYGGHSWPSMSYSPDTRLVYIPAIDLQQYLSARGVDPKTWSQPPFTQWMGYSDAVGRDQPPSSGEGATPDNIFGNDSSAWLQARDPQTNKTIWQVRQPGMWAGGTLTTRGGLVFIGQANGRFVAYDATSGTELWTFNCGRPISAPPISYSIGGIQYVSVLVGWGGTPAAEGALGDASVRMAYRDGGRRLLTFALDGRAPLPITPTTASVPIDTAGFEPDPAKVARGQHIFDVSCNVCHGTDAFSGGQAPDLRASLLATDPSILRKIVLEGALQLSGMPRYADLSLEDVDSIYHYIRFRARTDLKALSVGSKP